MTIPDPESMRAVAREIADSFAAAWSRGKPDLMVALFAEGATLIETPFAAPVSGLDAIRQWAADLPYNQSEATFTVGEIFSAGPWFSTEFKLSFRRRRTGDWVEARGAFFAETQDGKFTELRMYWHRWTKGREI
ncbi:MAG: nuclear transport factor 2 family protein [Gemmatimonadales bacterium]|nr:nuclear transport factor 2 family protein [Gemmatimonadales bacterium]